jgi:double-stranded uracil-DNA glycosylase
VSAGFGARSASEPLPGLPDVLAKGLKVVFCGINPGMRSAVVGHHFANRSNRFWRVLHRAGFTPELILPENSRSLLRYDCGLTSAVQKPTVGAAELARSDFVAARPKLERKMRAFAPQFLAFLGKPAVAAIFNLRAVAWGKQAVRFGETAIWVLPNPSGLNRAFSLEDLTVAYAELRAAVGDDGRPA